MKLWYDNDNDDNDEMCGNDNVLLFAVWHPGQYWKWNDDQLWREGEVLRNWMKNDERTWREIMMILTMMSKDNDILVKTK